VSAQALSLIIALLILLGIDAWVYEDARARAESGAPVTFSAGGFFLETPLQWFIACLLVWIVFLPLYVVRRSPAAQ
jgi:cytochrome c oxidase assembly factor CtaG